MALVAILSTVASTRTIVTLKTFELIKIKMMRRFKSVDRLSCDALQQT
jgi:hypothetical protein